MNRNDSLRQLRETREWDVLVIGGGATGLGAAVDAATRGYRTALVEQSDFAKGTSSRSTKLIHGGVRYLQQGNLALVRGALLERARLLQNAPHLVHPLSFVIPTNSAGEKCFYGIGLKLYDLLAGGHRISGSRFLSRREVIERAPSLEGTPLKGGIMYHDAQFDDARLAIALAQTFAGKGGAPLNYARVCALLKRGEKVCGATVRDEESGESYEISARVVINATGVFCDEIRHLDEPALPPIVAASQGAHLVLPKSYLPGNSAILIPRTADGRVLFAIPWMDRVLLGTTDVPVAKPELDPRPFAEELEFLVMHARKHLGWEIKLGDATGSYAGLRPLVRAGGSRRTSQVSRDHQVLVSKSSLVSILGGKWTTYRKMAEDVIDVAAKIARLPLRACRTKDLSLSREATLADNSAMHGDETIHPRLPYFRRDLIRGVREEMAMTLDDLLSRRTRSAVLDRVAAAEIAPEVASMMANELGRDEAWQRNQVAEFVHETTAHA